MGRGSMVFYESWIEAIKNLPREVQGEVLTAIIEYGLYGETTESLKPITRAMLDLVKPQIDNNNKRYENGCKGGRKKANQNQNKTESEPNRNQSETYNDKCKYDICNNDTKERESSKDNSLKKDSDSEFEKFWNLYDKKNNKAKVKAKFERLSKADKAKIFETLQTYLDNTPDKQFRKDPMTYLNNRTWEDEISLKPKNGNLFNQNQQAPAGVQLGYGERIVDGRRTYGTGKSTIPMDAPPRPADGYSWDSANKRWIYQ